MKYKFDAVFYYVSDLERSIRFYVDVLGLKLISRDIVARFDIDGVGFEIVPTKEKSKLQGGGNARLCLRVERVAEAVEQLRARGVAVSEPQFKSTGILASFRDLDGNEICLWEYDEKIL